MMTIILLCGVLLILCMNIGGVLSDPQTKLLMEDCTRSKISVEMSIFLGKFNKAFGAIRKKLSDNSSIHFATVDDTNFYAMVQCRNYLSSADCVACFDVARTRIRRTCPKDNGGHTVYEGCFLRYDVNNFYTQSIGVAYEATAGVCSPNISKFEATPFTSAVKGLITDIVAATPKTDGFFSATTRPVSNVGVTETVYAVAQCWETISQKDCQTCLTIGSTNLQSCPPGSDGSTVDAGCFLRYSDASIFADSSITNLKPYLQVAGTTGSKKIIIGGAVGGLCLFSLIVAVLLWYQLVRKRNITQRVGNILGEAKLQGPVMYSFKELKSGTRSFSDDSKIGEGGFGDVYKGIIKNGDIVAVKKLHISTSKAKADFVSELRLASNVNHRNIIRLLGCSGRGSELLLVFEYMANGSLDKFLYGENRGFLSWKQRVGIVYGIAKGLAYLHEQFHSRIIHRDIKSSNILLDDEFQPKIADFGLARLIREDQSHLSTTFAGTWGYTAPEYAIHGHLSEKVDTYSFGIVVLEIVGGQRCTITTEPATGSLLQHAWTLYEKDMHSDLIDETLEPDQYTIDDVKKIVEIALKCTQSPTSARPTMSEVVVLLTNDSSLDQKLPATPSSF